MMRGVRMPWPQAEVIRGSSAPLQILDCTGLEMGEQHLLVRGIPTVMKYVLLTLKR